MSRVQLQPAFLLHRRPYQESSLTLEALTRDFGRVGLLARGGRRPRRRGASPLQLFQPVLLSWSGRGELPLLTAVEAAGPASPLPPALLAHGFYLNELLLALLARNDAHPVVFAAYASALSALAADPATALRRFEVTLLEALGSLPPLVRTADGVPVEPAQLYRFDLERGPVPVADDATMHGLVRGVTLLALDAGQFQDPAVRRDAQRLMQGLVAHFLGDRTLKSRELLRRSSP